MALWYLCSLLILGIGASAEMFCEENQLSEYPKSVCYSAACTTAIAEHIEQELHAAFKYLYMGALFGQYTVERPGMTKFFLESASEERSHAIHMMDYLNMRGILYNKNYTFENSMLWKLSDHHITEAELKSLTIASALKEALEMEIEVTKRINAVVKACADDYHAADEFTDPILEEQHTGIRKLQGAIRTMNELLRGHPGEGRNFAEYVFDQKMVNGEL